MEMLEVPGTSSPLSLNTEGCPGWGGKGVSQVQNQSQRLHALYKEIMVSEPFRKGLHRNSILGEGRDHGF